MVPYIYEKVVSIKIFFKDGSSIFSFVLNDWGSTRLTSKPLDLQLSMVDCDRHDPTKILEKIFEAIMYFTSCS